MAITTWMVEDDLSKHINRRVNLVNKALKQNNIDYSIKT